MAMLEFDDVDVFYGKVQALRGLKPQVDEGEIVALLGNNGAGKTTTLSTAPRLVRRTRRPVRFNGQDITRRIPGTSWAPDSSTFRGPAHLQHDDRAGEPAARRLPGCKDRRQVPKRIERVYELLPLLAQRRAQQGGTLSGGEQQMLAIGRGLVAGPKMLMLDEPSMGLAPLIVAQVMQVISEIRDQGTTVLLVEQKRKAALKVTDRAYVIDGGATTIEGRASDLIADPRIVDAYLGA